MKPIDLSKAAKGDNLLGYLFIKSQLVKTAANGSRYFNMTLSDSDYNGMNAKMWDVKPVDEEEFTTGKKLCKVLQICTFRSNLNNFLFFI